MQLFSSTSRVGEKYFGYRPIHAPMTKDAGKVLFFDSSRCTACHYCEVACSYFHFDDIDLKMSNVRILFDERTGAREAIHCLHCDTALCLAACPVEAIHRDDDGHVLVNPLKCIGCGSCVVACPVGAAWMSEKEGIARKCDFCDGKPRCAQYCSPGAIAVLDRAEAKRRLSPGGS